MSVFLYLQLLVRHCTHVMADRTSKSVFSSNTLLCTYSVSKQDFNSHFLATIWTFAFDDKSLTILNGGDKNILNRAMFGRLLAFPRFVTPVFVVLPRVKSSFLQHFFHSGIGKWLRSPINIKKPNRQVNSYVGRPLTPHILFYVHTLCIT